CCWLFFFFFSSRRRHTRFSRDWSSDVCSSDLGTRTFTMIKPDAVEAGSIGGILNMIAEGGFRIVAMKLTQLTVADAKKFYEVHAERPFYGELVEFMSRGP